MQEVDLIDVSFCILLCRPLEEDLTVQGPLPYEPDDAPWKKSDSGIRKL